MTQEQILNSNFTKTKKAFLLFDLGYTRTQVSELITNGNYGFAHNIWKKWNEQTTVQPANVTALPFEFSFNRSFGIELETYGVTRDRLITAFANEGITLVGEEYNHSTRSHWKIVRDGSIQGDNGNEIVSPVLFGLDGINQIKKVTIALNKAGAKVNNSCGFHVHFGITDLTIDNIKNLAKSHIEIESSFDSIVPSSRRKNNNSYCKSLTSIATNKTLAISKINAANTINEFVSVMSNRYVKMNFQSYTRQGTVEFRQHSGTTTFSKIKNWILICARIIEYTKANGFTNDINFFLNESLQDYISDRAVDLAA
jgi:hypothetical protein